MRNHSGQPLHPSWLSGARYKDGQERKKKRKTCHNARHFPKLKSLAGLYEITGLVEKKERKEILSDDHSLTYMEMGKNCERQKKETIKINHDRDMEM